MKIDISKPITLTSSKAGEDYLDLNMTLESGKPIKITALISTMAGIGIMLTKIANRVMAEQMVEGEAVKWDAEIEDLN